MPQRAIRRLRARGGVTVAVESHERAWPLACEFDFNGAKTIEETDVFSVQATTGAVDRPRNTSLVFLRDITVRLLMGSDVGGRSQRVSAGNSLCDSAESPLRWPRAAYDDQENPGFWETSARIRGANRRVEA